MGQPHNPWAGEVALVLDGIPHLCKLTLGALAELETQLGEASLVGLVERFEADEVSATDVLGLVVAGLRGGGWTGTARDLLSVDIEGGPIAASKAAARMLTLAFALPGEG